MDEDYFDNSSMENYTTLFNQTPYLTGVCSWKPPNEAPEPFTIFETVIMAAIFGLMILCMIFGNLLVIMAIVIERDLQRTQYYLILSLAVADLLVGVAVSPFAAMLDIHKEWRLGVYMCDFWTCMDVLACTSSILHLVAIALDRYWSITDVTYMQKRTPKRILLMLTIVWIVSLVISVAPVLGWKDDAYHQRVANRECLISQDITYQLVSTTAAFYGPLLFIIVLYWQIYKAARHRIRLQQKRRQAAAAMTSSNSMRTLNVTEDEKSALPSTVGQKLALLLPAASKLKHADADGSSNFEQCSSYSLDNLDSPAEELNASVVVTPTKLSANGVVVTLDSESADILPSIVTPTSKTSSVTLLTNGSSFHKHGHNRQQNCHNGPQQQLLQQQQQQQQKKKAKKKESLESKRERRAGRTLAIITGIFVVCWVPFFTLALFRPICAFFCGSPCFLPTALESAFVWLGYLNSALNPILYTIFSPDFRQGFQKILKRLWYFVKT